MDNIIQRLTLPATLRGLPVSVVKNDEGCILCVNGIEFARVTRKNNGYYFFPPYADKCGGYGYSHLISDSVAESEIQITFNRAISYVENNFKELRILGHK